MVRGSRDEGDAAKILGMKFQENVPRQEQSFRYFQLVNRVKDPSYRGSHRVELRKKRGVVRFVLFSND